MCLVLAQKPKKQSGIGWKLVYHSWDNEKKEYVYHPQYRAFKKNGKGGCDPKYYTDNESLKAKYLYSSKLPMYRIGETYTVRHKNMAVDSYGNLYRAGVHLYLDEPTCVPPLMKVLKCMYDEAIADDGVTVAALKVTPLEDVTKSILG